jgi:AcrR family transcriptional regulator
MPPVKPTPRRKPRQERSKAMVEAILDATIRVLVARGYEGTTTIAVAERAGVSVGSLYQYFPNKEALVAAVAERQFARLLALGEEIFPTLDVSEPRSAVRTLVRAGIDAHRINPRLHKILTEQAPRIGRLKAALDTSKVTRALFAAWLRSGGQGLTTRDPDVAAFVVEVVVEALTHRFVIERPNVITESELEREATDLVTAYLCGINGGV